MNDEKLSKKLNQIYTLVGECLNLISVDRKATEEKRPQKGEINKIHGLIEKDLDFSIPLRPFVKKYGANMSGPKKFTLILAYLAEGNLEKMIDLTEIEKAWNSMTAIIGFKFNRFYSQTAKDNDWVTTEKKGAYSLRPSWTNVLN